MNNWQQRQDLVRNCKGAAASIILLLLLADSRSLTAVELQRGTNYSDKPVSDALAWLEPRGIVQYNGRSQGWSLATGARQLDFIRYLTATTAALLIPVSELDVGSHGSTGEIHVSPPSHGVPEFGESLCGTHEPHADSQQTAAIDGDEHGIFPCSDRNISDLSHVCMFKHKHVFQKDFKNIHAKHAETRNISDLRAVLSLVGIKGKNLDILAERVDLPPPWPLAWWLDLQSQDWEPENPAGWVFVRLQEGRPPQAKFAYLAEVHLQECGHDLALPQVDKADNGRCPDCGNKIKHCICELVRRGVIKR